MCRMLAARAARGEELRDVLLAFRKQSNQSGTGPEEERHHRDGWGIAAFGKGDERLILRRPTNAFKDPTYEAAVETISGFTAPLVVVHFRNASVGSHAQSNSHPFVDGEWVFAHNGTVKDAARIELEGETYEGTTDSERYFRRVTRAIRSGKAPSAALRTVADEIASLADFTSVTALLTNGRTVYGYRRMGTDLSDCGTTECQAEYYTLCHGRKGGVTIVTQEQTHLGDVKEWTPLEDDGIFVWEPHQAPRTEPARGRAVPHSMARAK